MSRESDSTPRQRRPCSGAGQFLNSDVQHCLSDSNRSVTQCDKFSDHTSVSRFIRLSQSHHQHEHQQQMQQQTESKDLQHPQHLLSSLSSSDIMTSAPARAAHSLRPTYQASSRRSVLRSAASQPAYRNDQMEAVTEACLIVWPDEWVRP